MKLAPLPPKFVNAGLAIAAVAVGYAFYGWPGVFLAFTIIVFWLLLQFSRMLRVLRGAASRPAGLVDSAVMLRSRLQPGLAMLQVLRITGSLGRRLPHASPGAAESWEWRDGGGDAVVVDFADGRCLGSSLVRATPAGAASDTSTAPTQRLE